MRTGRMRECGQRCLETMHLLPQVLETGHLLPQVLIAEFVEAAWNLREMGEGTASVLDP